MNRREIRATHRVTSIVVYTKVDEAQCDKLATVVNVDNTRDVQWRNFFKSRVWKSFRGECATLIFRDTTIHLNTICRINGETSCQNSAGSVLTEHRLVDL